MGADLGFEPAEDELAAFSGSVADWPAFPDSAAALASAEEALPARRHHQLRRRPLRASNRRLGVEFDWVVTAQQARGYKPNPANFVFAFERIDVPRERILHVAQSLFHDHVPAKALGMTTVWINRRQGRAGFGATPPAEAVPDLVVPDMRSFAALTNGHEPGELGAAADPELAEHVAEVVLDRLRAHEQRRRGLPVREPLRDELGDAQLVRGQLRLALGRRAGRRAGDSQLTPRALGERGCLDLLEAG